jgi:hypothetical protein
VHERLLSAAGLRLVPDENLTRLTLLRGVRDRQLVLRLEDGSALDADGTVEGPTGARRRIATGVPHTLAITEDVLVALPSAPAVAGWMAVDAPAGSGAGGGPTPLLPPPPPAPAGDLHTSDLTKAIEAAASRPLVQLVLSARTPAAARLLASLAQPFGASSISLNVSVAGEVKGGGTMGLNVEGVRHTHPTKPLELATTIANSLTSAESFEASFTLEFEPGLLMATHQLTALREQAGDVRASCRFGPSAGDVQ